MPTPPTTGDWTREEMSLANFMRNHHIIEVWKYHKAKLDKGKKEIEETIRPNDPRLARRMIRELKRDLWNVRHYQAEEHWQFFLQESRRIRREEDLEPNNQNNNEAV